MYKKILKSNGYQEFFGKDFCLEQLDSELKYLNKEQKSELIMIIFEALEKDLQKFSSAERNLRQQQI